MSPQEKRSLAINKKIAIEDATRLGHKMRVRFEWHQGKYGAMANPCWHCNSYLVVTRSYFVEGLRNPCTAEGE